MKIAPACIALVLISCVVHAQTSDTSKTPDTAKPAVPANTTAPVKKTVSEIFDWNKMQITPTATGERRLLINGPTATVDKLDCHITTLKPGEKSGEPSKHLQEEIIIVKEGSLEANYDGHAQVVGPGSVIYFAAGATTFLRNAGTTPVTYTVIYYITPLTPKS